MIRFAVSVSATFFLLSFIIACSEAAKCPPPPECPKEAGQAETAVSPKNGDEVSAPAQRKSPQGDTSTLQVTKEGYVSFPQPDKTGGKPLMETFDRRESIRKYTDRPVSLLHLSNMLWAAFGLNRDGKRADRRTAPSAMGDCEVDIYVALKSGLFIYEAEKHRLKQLSKTDLRAATGKQKFAATAPINLIFVADKARMSLESEEDRSFYAAVDTGYISQNVYLYCASEGLDTIVRGWVDKEALAKQMKLGATRMIVLAQTVGYKP